MTLSGPLPVMRLFEDAIIQEFGDVHREVLADGDVLTFGAEVRIGNRRDPETDGAAAMNLSQYRQTLFRKRLQEITDRAFREEINPVTLLDWVDGEITRRVESRHRRALHRRESTRTDWRSDERRSEDRD